MDKIYYLASCDTCRKIIKSLPENQLEFHDIRQNPLTETELEEMKNLAGSYEALFSRKAQLYKSLVLKDKTLTEPDYKKYLLEHYTFFEPSGVSYWRKNLYWQQPEECQRGDRRAKIKPQTMASSAINLGRRADIILRQKATNSRIKNRKHIVALGI
jgi:arsenate reductase